MQPQNARRLESCIYCVVKNKSNTAVFLLRLKYMNVAINFAYQNFLGKWKNYNLLTVVILQIFSEFC